MTSFVPCRALFCFIALGGVGLLFGGGCRKPEAKAPPPPPPEVFVAQPVEDMVVDFEEYPGRLAAAESVEIRSRVTGYLEKVHFKDGEYVKAGDVLFEIDSRPYQAELERAQAELEQAQAKLERMKRQEDRAKSLIETKAISQENFDQATFDRAESSAIVSEARATLEMAKLNVGYTKISAKISGRISRRMIDPGNLIKSDDTILATIMSVDPMHAYFAIDERTLLRLRRMIQDGTLTYGQDSSFPVQISLADESDFSRDGLVTFLDNHVDAQTGTLAARADIDNSSKMLSPGLFVRMRTPIGPPHQSLLIPEEALGSDQGERFLYVVNDEKKVEYRRVKVGRATNGRRVISEGLKLGEKVIVSGLQRVKPGQVVDAKPAEALAGKAKEEISTPKTEVVRDAKTPPTSPAEKVEAKSSPSASGDGKSDTKSSD